MMDRALPRPQEPLGARRLLVAAGWTILLTVNAVMVAITLYTALTLGGWGFDWYVYQQAAELYPNLYAPGSEVWFSYAPLVAVGFGLLAPVGVTAWTLLHFLPLLALPRHIALIVLASWPFWDDVYNGNVMVFVFVAAWHALRGSMAGKVAFLVLAVLAPRPLMIPIMAWLLWHDWRLFVVPTAVFLANAATGLVPEWIAWLLSGEASNLGGTVEWGPARLIGVAWVPVGAVLAVWLTIKGRLGLASLCTMPYWLPPYLLMGLLELARRGAAHPTMTAKERPAAGGGAPPGRIPTKQVNPCAEAG